MVKFDIIAKDIVENDRFQSLKNDPHHGLTRYDHVLRVAKNTYRLSKIMKLDYISATRGALLHDYFNDCDYQNTKGIKKASIHPVIALNNARRDYYLNEKEENIIISHMYPFGKNKPNCKESWLVNNVDNAVALYECVRFKFKDYFVLLIIIMTNLIKM